MATMASVDDLGPLLKALTTLKPPGVSKSKITDINNICIEHIASDTAIVNTISKHYQTTPNTHKLGVLYVVDSVTRKWVERAHQAAQPLIGAASAPGTFASGIHKMTVALPTMMNDLIISAPTSQKDKVAKLVDIWEQAKTFPEDILGDFKRKLTGPIQNESKRMSGYTGEARAGVRSITQNSTSSNIIQPDSSSAKVGEPSDVLSGFPSNQSNQVVGVPPNSVGMPLPLLSLQGPPAVQPNPTSNDTGNQQNVLLAALQAAMQQPGQPTSSMATASNPAPVLPMLAHPAMPSSFPIQPASQPVSQTVVSGPSTALPMMPSLSPEHVTLLQALVAQGVPPDQIARVVQALGISLPPPPPPIAVQASAAPIMPFPTNVPNVSGSAHAIHEYKRSRSQSRSPDFNKRRRVTPPNRRESPVYGVYDPDAARNQASQTLEQDRRNRRNGRGRQSPAGRQNGRQPSPTRAGAAMGVQPRYIEWDRTLPKGHIRVLSRTLFVGGVAAPEHEIRNILARFGKVQTCIVNMERRHAFVKMVNRPDAVRTKQGMEQETDPDILSKARSIRWGVGFGPRDCNDYNTGESVIPLSALTEADKKWIVSAEYGGTGGRPVEAGMVLEEPDIEIGAGVSSKAISRRVETSTGGHKRQNHNAGSKQHQNQVPQQKSSEPTYQERYTYAQERVPAGAPVRPAYEQSHHRSSEPIRARPAQPVMLKPEPNTVGVPPAVPGFGFSLPGERPQSKDCWTEDLAANS